MAQPSGAGPQFAQLVALMARLRAPDGCPWDREQTFDTIKPYTLEETYEVLDAIDARDWAHLAEELGDFLLQAVFYAQIAAEAGHFTIEDCLEAINSKLVRRHPHIFGDAEAHTAADVKATWDRIKAQEKGAAAPKALLDKVPRALPALMEAQAVSEKAAKTGFDWPDAEQVIDKLHEELAEVREARAGEVQEQVEDEIGDLLFVVVNLARKLNVDAEQALRKSTGKFRRRFGHVEESLREEGRQLAEASLDEMEALWQQAKQRRG